MKYETENQVTMFDQDIWCGKTFPEVSHLTVAKTSKPSSRKLSESPNPKLPMCLCLRKADGRNQDAFIQTWEHGALLGEYTTRSFGEFPKEENASRLSQILEDCPHPKYCLSAKACQGILNRANNRGKELPKKLYQALIAQIERERERVSSAAVDVYNQSVEGETAPTITAAVGGTNTSGCKVMQEPVLLESNQNNATIQTNGVSTALPASAGMGGGYVPMITDDKPSLQGINGEIAGTIDGHYYLGCGARGGKEREVVYGVTAKGNGDAFINEEKHTSLSTGGGEPGQGYPCIIAKDTFCIDQGAGKSSCSVTEDVSPTLACTHDGAPAVSYNRNEQEVIALEGNGSRPSHKGDGYSENDVSYTLNAVEQHAVCTDDTDKFGGGVIRNNPNAMLNDSEANGQSERQNVSCYGFKHRQGSAAKGIGYEYEISPTLPAESENAVLIKKDE